MTKHLWAEPNDVVRWPHCSSCGVIRPRDGSSDEKPCPGPASIGLRAEGRSQSPGPWCPVCRQPVPATGMAWTFAPHGGCDGEGRRVRDRDHGFVTADGRTVPEWEFDTTPERHLIDVETVEAIFDAWIDDLVTHHGHRRVADVLSSPAIQAMFTGDVGQSVLTGETT